MVAAAQPSLKLSRSFMDKADSTDNLAIIDTSTQAPSQEALATKARHKPIGGYIYSLALLMEARTKLRTVVLQAVVSKSPTDGDVFVVDQAQEEHVRDIDNALSVLRSLDRITAEVRASVLSILPAHQKTLTCTPPPSFGPRPHADETGGALHWRPAEPILPQRRADHRGVPPFPAACILDGPKRQRRAAVQPPAAVEGPAGSAWRHPGGKRPKVLNLQALALSDLGAVSIDRWSTGSLRCCKRRSAILASQWPLCGLRNYASRATSHSCSCAAAVTASSTQPCCAMRKDRRTPSGGHASS